MKLNVVLSNHFKKDLKLLLKRGYNLDLMNSVVEKLAHRIPLEEKYRDRSLVGNYAGFRECHITPDWLLIYRINETDVILFLSRTGTHSDLFKQ